MQIVSDNFRREIEKPFVMLDAVGKGSQCFEVFEIADVMRQKGEIVFGQTKRVFELGAAREDLPAEFERGFYRRGRKAARTAQNDLGFGSRMLDLSALNPRWSALIRGGISSVFSTRTTESSVRI